MGACCAIRRISGKRGIPTLGDLLSRDFDPAERVTDVPRDSQGVKI
jgi:hypothetical protein